MIPRFYKLEGKEHLREMEEGIQKLFSGEAHAEKVCALESELCGFWLKAIWPEKDK